MVESIVATLSETTDLWRDESSDVATDSLAANFADVLRVHHLSSAEPFTKDKFEHAMVGVLRDEGRDAVLAPRGNPGHDITVDDSRWSLKTQADANIKRDRIHISKFMELGKGKWEDEQDLRALAEAMFRHMEGYDRIFTLRCLSQNKNSRRKGLYEYELVEIPKALFLRARDGEFVMKHNSSQFPKPGYCTVLDDALQVLFQLYFDGGTERKLQIKNLAKEACRVHAAWRIQAAPL